MLSCIAQPYMKRVGVGFLCRRIFSSYVFCLLACLREGCGGKVCACAEWGMHIRSFWYLVAVVYSWPKVCPFLCIKTLVRNCTWFMQLAGWQLQQERQKLITPVKDLAVWLVTQSSSLHVTTNLLSEWGSAIELTMSNWYSQKVLIHT